MRTRTLNRRDLRRCADLLVLSRRVQQDAVEDRLRRLRTCFDSDYCCAVVAEEGAVTGFAMGNCIPHHFGNIFYMREMCTHPDYRRRGVGSMIYRALEVKLVENGVASIYLPDSWAMWDMDFFFKRGFYRNENTGIYSHQLSH